VTAAVTRLSIALGIEVRDERIRRGWTLAQLAEKAGVSVSMAHGVESGVTSSVEGYVRIALALGLAPDFTFTRARAATRAIDPVHAAMGDVQARKLRPTRPETHLDEPYQHFQYAGRADVVSVSPDGTSLLHIENRTRFPDIGGFAGSYNAKRAYLARNLGRILVDPGRLRSETHVVAALWSSEVLHVLRLREASFRAVAPDPPDAFAAWWNGAPPPAGRTSTLIVFDPLAHGRSRTWIGLDEALRARPRYRGYAEALAALQAAGLA
jgi:transcriptional regulator with XRE-family HTH domain